MKNKKFTTISVLWQDKRQKNKKKKRRDEEKKMNKRKGEDSSYRRSPTYIYRYKYYHVIILPK